MPLTHERRESNKLFLGLASAVLVGCLTWLVSSAWATKADRADLVAHIQTDQRLFEVQQVKDSAWRMSQHAIMIEILCRQNPNSRRCR